jgi:hypothetical protein
MAIFVYDSKGNKRAWAGNEDDASLAKAGLSKTKPINQPKTETPKTASVVSTPTKFTRTSQIEAASNGDNVVDMGNGTSLVRKAGGGWAGVSNKYLNDSIDANGLFIGYTPSKTSGRGSGSSSGSSSSNSQSSEYDIMSEINRAKNSRISSRKAALQGLRDKTLTSLAGEKTGVKQQYYDEKNNESSSAQLRAKKIGELMASKGYSEGSQAQNELTANVGLQGALGSLNRQEQSAYDDITKRGTDAETAYQSGLTQAEADAETTAIEQRLAELGTQRDYGRQDEQIAYERGVEAQGRTDATLETEKSDFIKNTTMYSYPDIQAEINTIMNDNDTANDWKIPILKDIRGQKIEKQLNEEIKTAGQYSGNFQSEISRREKTSDPLDNALIPYLKAMAAEQQATPSERYKQLWDMFMKTGVITTQEMADVLGQPVGTTTTDYLQTKYNIGKPYSGGGSSSGSSSGAEREVPWYLQ